MRKMLRIENKAKNQYATPEELGEFMHDVVNILLSGPASADEGANFVGVFQEQVM
jgi:Na+/serine symporter